MSQATAGRIVSTARSSPPLGRTCRRGEVAASQLVTFDFGLLASTSNDFIPLQTMMKWAYLKTTPRCIVLGAFVLAACGDSSNGIPAETGSLADASNDERRIESGAEDVANAEHPGENGAGGASIAIADRD